MTLRVGLNATALLSPLTGIGHYVHSLATALQADADLDLEFFYGSRWSRQLRDGPVPGIGAAKQAIKRFVPAPYRLTRAVAQSCFTLGARRRRVALYHEPSIVSFRFSGPTVLTVHDLAWVVHPESHPADRVAHMNRVFPRSLAAAAAIITDAEYVRRQVIDTYGIDPARVTAIPLAARSIFRPRGREECQPLIAALGLAYGDFLLCVGTIEPRKNLATVLRAFAALPAAVRRRHPLVIVGMRGWLSSPLQGTLEPLVNAGEVRVLGYVDDPTLAAVYAACRVLIYPSLYEGFGLPPLEAMASGVPVIASTASTLPEVLGPAGILVAPTDAEALAAAMGRIVDDEALRRQLQEAGLAQARQFSWERCARETAAVYRSVA